MHRHLIAYPSNYWNESSKENVPESTWLFMVCENFGQNCLQKSLWAKLLLISKIYQYLHRSRFTICFAFNYERLVIFIWPRFDLKKQFICRRLLYNLWRTLNWKERGLNKLLDRWLNFQSFDKPLYKLEHVLNMNVVYFGIML